MKTNRHKFPKNPTSHRMNSASLATLARMVFVLSVFVFALPAAALDVTFDVQPRLLNLGETATAMLEFHGAQGINGLNLPDVDGLSITSPSIMQQNINGAHSVRMNYRIVPRRAGSFVIGPYTLDLNGETIQIPEIGRAHV